MGALTNIKRKIGRFVGISALLLIAGVVHAQQTKSIQGLVLDESNQPLIGATVRVTTSTMNGGITDVDGLFKLDNVRTGDTLRVSYIGYQDYLQVVKASDNFFRISLSPDETQLEEVVVVGYGQQKKASVVGAIATVSVKELKQSPVSNVSNALAGRLPGLITVQRSGEPGADQATLYIRGISTFGSGQDPLILIDGIDRGKEGLAMMESSEIENISILKDASATAVYGVRGANGVVLVTTRRGTVGKPVISFSVDFGLQSPSSMPELVGAYDMAVLTNEALVNNGQSPKYSQDQLNIYKNGGGNPFLYPDVNWYDEVLKKNAYMQQYNASITGGSEKMQYFVAANVLRQEGIFRRGAYNDNYSTNVSYTKYNFRSNLDFQLNNVISAKLTLAGVIGDKRRPSSGVNAIFERARVASPNVTPIRNPDGTWGAPPTTNHNVLAHLVSHGYSKEAESAITATLGASADLSEWVKGLSVNVDFSFDFDNLYTYNHNKNDDMFTFGPNVETYPHMVIGSPLGFGGNINSYNTRYVIEPSIRYNNTFGSDKQHAVSGLILMNAQENTIRDQEVAYRRLGIVGRVTYGYRDKYLAEVNAGYNGSENFAPGKRFGAFPAGSVGYIISEEAFMKNQKIVDYLKLRASVGLVGNDKLGNNRFLYLPDGYNVGLSGVDGWNNNKYGFNFGYNSKAMVLGALEKRLANKNVTWETALKQNYGIDMHFLGNRLKLAVDYFRENRKDIIINRKTVPLISGLTADIMPAVNMGKVKNQGYEIEVKWDDKIGEWGYNINANMSYSKNKIVFQDEVEPNEPYMWATGRPVGSIIGYVADGFYQETDFDEQGNLLPGYANPNVAVKPGDVKYRDLNNDNVIDSDDQTMIGHSNRPAYTFGLNYGINYKGFFLTMNWTGAAQRSLLLDGAFREPFGNGKIRGLMQFHVDTRWTPETAYTATTPRFTETNATYNMRKSSLWVYDGAYLKLKNVTIGYNFTDKKFLKKLGIQQLGIKLTGYNLLTFDKFDIMDPECNPNGSDAYPITKIYNLGVNLTF